MNIEAFEVKDGVERKISQEEMDEKMNAFECVTKPKLIGEINTNAVLLTILPITLVVGIFGHLYWFTYVMFALNAIIQYSASRLRIRVVKEQYKIEREIMETIGQSKLMTELSNKAKEAFNGLTDEQKAQLETMRGEEHMKEIKIKL